MVYIHLTPFTPYFFYDCMVMSSRSVAGGWWLVADGCWLAKVTDYDGNGLKKDTRREYIYNI